MSGKDDGLVMVRPVLDRVENFGDLIQTDAEDPTFAVLRAAEATGRALGTADFVADLERRLGRPIARRAPGRKTSKKDVEESRGSTTPAVRFGVGNVAPVPLFRKRPLFKQRCDLGES